MSDMNKRTNKKGNFITKDGRVIFIGGPSAGSGSTTDSGMQSIEDLFRTGTLTSLEKQDYEKGDFPSSKKRVEGDGDVIVKPGKERDKEYYGEELPNTAVSEVAAYEIAERLGYSGLIPPTVLREDASVQGWVDNSVRSDSYNGQLVSMFGDVSEDSLKQITLLDCLINNGDRHPGNLLVTTVGGKARAVGIDNGLSFRKNAVNVAEEVGLVLTYNGYTFEDCGFSKPRFTAKDVAPIRNLLNDSSFWERSSAQIGVKATQWMRERAEYMVTPAFLELEW